MRGGKGVNMSPVDFVQVLRHPSSKLTKTWKQDGTIEAYTDPKRFVGKEKPLANIHDLSKLLTKLESDTYSCVIRGKYKGYAHSLIVEPDETQRNRVLRRKSVHDDPAHHWMLVDIDNYKPVDFDPLLDPVGAIGEYITTSLPPCFHGASYHWQLSSSAGHPSKPAGALKAHVWFWLKTPYTSAQLRAWAGAVSFKGDKALFDTIQVHYTSAPIIEDGVDNPITHRSGFQAGDFGDAVTLVIDDEVLRLAGDGTTPASRHQKLTEVLSTDPVVELLYSKKMVKSKRPDGGLNITCPRNEHHTGDSGESSTIYYTAFTGGHKDGAFVCLHEHCRGVSQSLFLEALGYDDLDGVFGPIGRVVQLVRGDSVIPEAIVWLFRGWLAIGKLILLAGSPGTGKTTLAMYFAAVITKGGTWPDGERCEVGSVVIWSGEDSPSDTLVPRLLACNAEMKRVHFVGGTVDLENPRSFDPAKDMPLLSSEIERIGDVRLIVVDPIVSAVAGDSHKNAEVRRALQPVVDLAAKINASLIGITHFSKGTAGRDTTERVTGSLAFAALARIVLATARDTETGDFLLTRSKSNIGPDGGGWRYKLEQIDITQYPGVEASRVVWGESLEGTAQELITEAEGDAKGKPDDNSAGGWLRNLLSIQPMLATEVFEHGQSRGYSQRKLQRVLHDIGGVSEKSGFRGPAYWRLPGSLLSTVGEPDPLDDGMGEL